MTKKEYLEKILSLCTLKERVFYDRLFPFGAPNNQINTAIKLVERTLFAATHDFEFILEKSKKIESEVSDKNDEILRLTSEIKQLKIENDEFQKNIFALKHGISVDRLAELDRLNKLDRLEQAGVDNWEGYE